MRIFRLSEIRMYPDHLTNQKSMPQIQILEYTIFRAFFSETLFSEHFFVICTLLHGCAYPSSKNFDFVRVLLFFLYENIAKNEGNLVEENDEEHYDENLWLSNRLTDGIFEAFVIVTEISIFVIENSTLMTPRPLMQFESSITIFHWHKKF